MGDARRLDADHDAGEVDQDRCEGGASREVREAPTGRSGGFAKTVCRHPGAHPTAACCALHGPFMMTRQAPRNGSRRDTSGVCHAPNPRNDPERPPWHPDESASSAWKTGETRKQGWRNGGRTLYNDDHGPAGVAGRGQMGNVS